MERLEQDWVEYPVLHFDLSGGKHMQEDALVRYLLFILKQHEEKWGNHDGCAPTQNVRLLNLISQVYKQTGKQVVILIDEYDAPLLDVVHEESQLVALRQILRNFFQSLEGF